MQQCQERLASSMGEGCAASAVVNIPLRTARQIGAEATPADGKEASAEGKNALPAKNESDASSIKDKEAATSIRDAKSEVALPKFSSKTIACENASLAALISTPTDWEEVLQSAAEYGNVRLVAYARQQGACRLQRALPLACKAGSQATVAWLLGYGAEANFDAVSESARMGDWLVLRMLLADGARRGRALQNRAMEEACAAQQVGIARRLLRVSDRGARREMRFRLLEERDYQAKAGRKLAASLDKLTKVGSDAIGMHHLLAAAHIPAGTSVDLVIEGACTGSVVAAKEACNLMWSVPTVPLADTSRLDAYVAGDGSKVGAVGATIEARAIAAPPGHLTTLNATPSIITLDALALNTANFSGCTATDMAALAAASEAPRLSTELANEELPDEDYMDKALGGEGDEGAEWINARRMLPWACEGGSTILIQELLRRGADDYDGGLRAACEFEREDAAWAMLRCGADPSAALPLAVAAQCMPLVRALLRLGPSKASIFAALRIHEEPTSVALALDAELARHLGDQPCECHLLPPKPPSVEGKCSAKSKLSAENNNLRRAERSFDGEGAAADLAKWFAASSQSWDALLEYASHRGWVALVDYALHRGATNVDAALRNASSAGRTNVVWRLLRAGPTSAGLRSAATIAVHTLSWPLLRILSHYGSKSEPTHWSDVLQDALLIGDEKCIAACRLAIAERGEKPEEEEAEEDKAEEEEVKDHEAEEEQGSEEDEARRGALFEARYKRKLLNLAAQDAHACNLAAFNALLVLAAEHGDTVRATQALRCGATCTAAAAELAARNGHLDLAALIRSL